MADMDSASIGEEMDEHFMFGEHPELNRSQTSLASLASESRKTSSKGFSLGRLWRGRKEAVASGSSSNSSRLSSTVCEVPKIKCSHYVSSPTQPQFEAVGGVASSWTYGYQCPLKHNSSFSSVDEESYQDETIVAPEIDERPELEAEAASCCNSDQLPTRSKSRLSLNLIASKEKEKSPSPRLLPRFLRSSFSRLLHKTNKDPATEATTPPSEGRVATPSTDGITHGISMSSINDQSSVLGDSVRSGEDRVTPNDLITMTPSTLEFLEEAKLSGLPVIPFAYPTCVLVSKKTKSNNESFAKEARAASNSSSASETPKKARVSLFHLYSDDSTKSPPNTLESIVDLAQKQLKAEQPFEDFEDDFFCGSIGSISNLSDGVNSTAGVLCRNAVVTGSNFFIEDLDHHRPHDYLEMSASLNSRSVPIRIKSKQY